MMHAGTVLSGRKPGVDVWRWAGWLLGILLAGPVVVPVAAHDGEVHDDFPQPAVGQTGAPRFAVSGAAVEVVGALQDGQLWLYVSRYASNAPWSGLRIEVERDGGAVQAEAVTDGVYRLPAGALELKGRHTVVITLQGDGLDELLLAQLVIETDPPREAGPPWQPISLGLSLLAVAVVVHLLHGWRVKRRKQQAE